MVENTGASLHADTCKPINTPEQVSVEEDASGLPVVAWLPRRQRIMAIEDRWRIDDEWWRCEPVSRVYHVILLASGQCLVFYKDIINGCWYRQSC